MHSQPEPHPDRVPARPTDPRLRVGDDERGRVVDQLADHHAAGRLTLDEFEERMSAAWTARTGGELEVLVRDLPALPKPAQQARTRPRLTLDSPTRTYLAVIALLWVIWLVTGAGYPWPVWPMLGWGIGVAGRQRGAWAGR
jgi:Domain of unknown function (DUF1707)/2TM domain